MSSQASTAQWNDGEGGLFFQLDCPMLIGQQVVRGPDGVKEKGSRSEGDFDPPKSS
jgi:hypothetical protein